jgi:hypothetical protein
MSLTKTEHSLIVRAIDSVWRRSERRKDFVNAMKHYIDVFKQDGDPAKKRGVRWVCNNCAATLKSDEFQVDHIESVVPVGMTTMDMSWDAYIDRRICSPDSNLQILCKPCHKDKSLKERRLRKQLCGRKRE